MDRYVLPYALGEARFGDDQVKMTIVYSILICDIICVALSLTYVKSKLTVVPEVQEKKNRVEANIARETVYFDAKTHVVVLQTSLPILVQKRNCVEHSMALRDSPAVLYIRRGFVPINSHFVVE